MIKREMVKAYVGFHNGGRQPTSPVATGKWGCGVFGGDPELKAVIQWLACSACQRPMIFFVFETPELIDVITKICERCRQIDIKTVGALWSQLMAYSTECAKILDSKDDNLRTFCDFLEAHIPTPLGLCAVM
jgi:poly(ADP-ribose) glycohydrolase